MEFLSFTSHISKAQQQMCLVAAILDSVICRAISAIKENPFQSKVILYK